MSSAASMAEALDCDLKPLLAAADGVRWVGATGQEALTAYREDLSLDSTGLMAWTGQRPARPAERLWLVCPDGAGRGVVSASQVDDGRWVVAIEQLCADFQPRGFTALALRVRPSCLRTQRDDQRRSEAGWRSANGTEWTKASSAGRPAIDSHTRRCDAPQLARKMSCLAHSAGTLTPPTS